VDIRKIIREELNKVLEGVGSDYYNNFPDFFDPQYNPQVMRYPVTGQHTFGSMVQEYTIEEEYSEIFNMDEFKRLTTLNEKLRYCDSLLKRIVSGPSIITYKIDDKVVLKIAKNKKGIAQNKIEIDNCEKIGHLDANIYDYDENYLWVKEMYNEEGNYFY
jgi:hypothetical protein